MEARQSRRDKRNVNNKYETRVGGMSVKNGIIKDTMPSTAGTTPCCPLALANALDASLVDLTGHVGYYSACDENRVV